MASERRFVATVAKEERIRLPKHFTQGIAWLADQNNDVSAKAIVGNEGGIRIAPSFEVLRRIQDSLKDPLTVKIDETTGPAIAALARYYDSVWDMKFGFEPSRFSLSLPEELRDIGLLPSHPQKAVVWSHGSILEIWKEVDWVIYLQKIGSNINEYLKLANHELS
jgi:hypothetical protein